MCTTLPASHKDVYIGRRLWILEWYMIWVPDLGRLVHAKKQANSDLQTAEMHAEWTITVHFPFYLVLAGKYIPAH